MESQEEMPRQQVQLESTQSAKCVSEDQIRSALKLLFEPGQVVELRVLRSGKSVVAGYFNDPEKLVLEAARWSGNASSVCITLNLVDPNLLARAENHASYHAANRTSDTEVEGRRWLLIDLDPKRPTGISSTDEEHSLALGKAKEIRPWLQSLGWSQPIFADSGNGAHLLYQIDLPNDAASRDLIKRVLESIGFRFQMVWSKLT